MRFWDSSAVLPLLVTEPTSRWLKTALKRDPQIVVWWGTEIECISALSRHERERTLKPDGVAVALRRLRELEQTWEEIEPHAAVRATAARLLRVHALRAADALQLAAAVAAAERQPATLQFVTLDDRLGLAAEREGFPLLTKGSST